MCARAGARLSAGWIHHGYRPGLRVDVGATGRDQPPQTSLPGRPTGAAVHESGTGGYAVHASQHDLVPSDRRDPALPALGPGAQRTLEIGLLDDRAWAIEQLARQGVWRGGMADPSLAPARRRVAPVCGAQAGAGVR